ncbi:flap endonuclease GEN homolog 1-like [Argonauta hians]
MGVRSLWNILEPVKQEVKLEELRGCKIAIDLNTWIVENKLCTPYEHIYLRNVFLRTIEFLKNGITPVFVIDGTIPVLKDSAIYKRRKINNKGYTLPFNRERSQNVESVKCVNILEYLGATCLVSNGEAEALCARLNTEEIVDACLTSDSDIFLYGAKHVYRKYCKKNHQCHLESYTSKDILEEFGLHQRSLICLALLVGCDYDIQGVKGIGPKYALSLLKELKSRNVDALERIMCWEDNNELQKLSEIRKEFIENKHCQECLHKVHYHSKIKCKQCRAKKTAITNCLCICHKTLENINLHEIEIEVREKALINTNFPSKKIIEEYLDSNKIFECERNIKWIEPDIKNLCQFVGEHLHMNAVTFFRTMVPLFVYWKINSYNFKFLQDLQPKK